jgi:hypothetical protein
MKKVSTWDTYVREVAEQDDRRIEVPISEDETYIIDYPTRRQGRMIQKAQRENDTDALLLGLLGDDVGARIMELAEDAPADVLDKLLLDVMRRFGMIPDEPDDPEPAKANGRAAKAATNGRARGKAPATKRKTASTRSSAASS